VAEDTRHTVEVGHGLDRRMVGERAEQAPRGEEHSRCARDHAPWSFACTDVVACLLMDLSSPSSLHEALRRVAVVKGAQLDSHAKVQSLVGGDPNGPTAAAAAARVLLFDDLLNEVEAQEVEKRTAAHVAGTEAHALVVSVGSCVR
jgi:hypothetical protein